MTLGLMRLNKKTSRVRKFGKSTRSQRPVAGGYGGW